MLDDGFEKFFKKKLLKNLDNKNKARNFEKKLLKNLDNKNKARNFANAFASKREQVL